MSQTLRDYEASIQEFASECQLITKLGIKVDKLVHTDHGHEDRELLTQGQQEQVWKVPYREEHNGEL